MTDDFVFLSVPRKWLLSWSRPRHIYSSLIVHCYSLIWVYVTHVVEWVSVNKQLLNWTGYLPGSVTVLCFRNHVIQTLSAEKHCVKLDRRAKLRQLSCSRWEARGRMSLSPIHHEAGSRTPIRVGCIHSIRMGHSLLPCFLYSNMVEWIGTHKIQISLGHAVRINWCSDFICCDRSLLHVKEGNKYSVSL